MKIDVRIARVVVEPGADAVDRTRIAREVSRAIERRIATADGARPSGDATTLPTASIADAVAKALGRRGVR